MVKKIILIFVVFLNCFCFSNILLAKDSYRIAIVKSNDIVPYKQAVEGIITEIEKGLNKYIIDCYEIEKKSNINLAITQEIIDKKTDIVFSVGTEAALRVIGEIGDIPLIISMVYEPIEEILAKKSSLDNVYSIYLKVPFKQRFSLIKEFMPEIHTISLIYRESKGKYIIKEAQEASQKTGINVKLNSIESLEDFDVILAKSLKESDALFMTLDQAIYNSVSAKKLLLFSARNKFPIIAFSDNYVKAGAIMSFSVAYKENGQRSAKVALEYLKTKKVKYKTINDRDIKISLNKDVLKIFGIKFSPKSLKKVDKIF